MRVMLDFEDCCVEWVDIAELDNLEDALDTYVAEYLTALDNPTAGFKAVREVFGPVRRKVTGSARGRIKALASDLFNSVFETIDAELEYSGDDAGYVADAIEKTFLQAIRVLDNRPE